MFYNFLRSFFSNDTRNWIRQFDPGHQKLLQIIEKLEREQRDVTDLEDAYNNLLYIYDIVGKSNREFLGNSERKVKIITDKPVAYDSPDHISPWGTKNDNSTNLKFNYKLAQLISLQDLSVLDLGCSGGGFVKSIIDMGCFAVGIEGSDYSQKIKRAEWATIPEYLFTADITEPFKLLPQNTIDNNYDEVFKFTIITVWEVIEHIEKEKLAVVFQNISSHLRKNGVVIMSVSPNEEVINGFRLHQTVEEKDWWLEECYKNGFEHHENMLPYFGNDYIRKEEDSPGSFYLILTRVGEPPLFKNKITDVI